MTDKIPKINPYGGIVAMNAMMVTLFCLLVINLVLVFLVLEQSISIPNRISENIANYFPVIARPLKAMHDLPELAEFWQKQPQGTQKRYDLIAAAFSLDILYAAIFGSISLVAWVVTLFFLFKKNITYVADCGPFRQGVEKRLLIRGAILLAIMSLFATWVNWQGASTYQTFISNTPINSDKDFYFYAIFFWATVFSIA